MTLVRLIAPEWLLQSNRSLPRVMEDLYSDEDIKAYNEKGYNVYYIPNAPTEYQKGVTVDGSHITSFDWVFVDYDQKDNAYVDKEEFLSVIIESKLPPTKIVDSGHGIHVYWKVSHLDAMSYLRFQRRLMRLFNTDEAICKIFQLMRLPGTINTKKLDNPVLCELLLDSGPEYIAEQLDKLLPPIHLSDEQYCKQHYEKTYSIRSNEITIDDTIPPKFGALLRSNKEVSSLWASQVDDRSASDFRLGHIMFANGFSKEEAASVLVNTAKATQRAPIHRQSYAENIINKIWTFELSEDKDKLDLSTSVADVLRRSEGSPKGARFPCHPIVDNTAHGFRLGQVIGLVAGSGVGKTAFALNMFRWFAQNNPDCHHFFIPLEQPSVEIAQRWATMCGDDTRLHEKVHIISNYDEATSNYRNLSLHEIKEYIVKFKRVTGHEIGCVVIDHIGVLKKKDQNGKTMELEDICHAMKSFAVETNTLLVMQSQTSREKAGIGDLELNKDAAYGTVYFESYVDYLITLWQPVKRCHKEEACPTVTAFKFCKIRHKKAKQDIIQEDTPYFMAFDSDKELMRDMTQDEITSFDYFLPKATNKRKQDRKTELVVYQSVPYKEQA